LLLTKGIHSELIGQLG